MQQDSLTVMTLPSKNLNDLETSYLKTFFLIIFALSFRLTQGQDYEAKIFEHRGDTLPHKILMPKNFNPQNAYPLLVVLHEAGGARQ